MLLMRYQDSQSRTFFFLRLMESMFCEGLGALEGSHLLQVVRGNMETAERYEGNGRTIQRVCTELR